MLNYYFKKVKYEFIDGSSCFINVIDKITNTIKYRVIFENNKIHEILKQNYKIGYNHNLWNKTNELNNYKNKMQEYWNNNNFELIEKLS